MKIHADMTTSDDGQGRITSAERVKDRYGQPLLSREAASTD
jgi:hypothetical protein